jgi:hypothetical protein
LKVSRSIRFRNGTDRYNFGPFDGTWGPLPRPALSWATFSLTETNPKAQYPAC